MEKITLIVSILAGLCLVGVIYLASVGESTEILMPILTVLVGYLVGKKQEGIVGLFRSKK